MDLLLVLKTKLHMIKNEILNYNFKKYIIDYEEIGKKIKIVNSNYEIKYVNNTIPNKVKILEIIKEDKKEIKSKIEYFNSKKDDYKIIIMFNEIILLFLGLIFMSSFFIGDLIFFTISLISLFLYFLIFLNYFKKIYFLAEEINILNEILSNNNYDLSITKELKNLTDNIKFKLSSLKYNFNIKNNNEV